MEHAASPGASGEDQQRQQHPLGGSDAVFEGQLNKFTNVVKGWQYRWFVLNRETGHLEYYLMESSTRDPQKRGRSPRGRQHLAGAVVLPSDEDSHTFNVNFASGESFKLRAGNARERQVWVDRLRTAIHAHDRALAQLSASASASASGSQQPQMPPTPPGARSHLSVNGRPSEQLQHLTLSLLDAFGSVHDIIHQAEIKNDELCRCIEALPSAAALEGPHCLDEDLLILKATSHAALLSLEQAITILQDFREVRQGPIMEATTPTAHISKSLFASSPKKTVALSPGGKNKGAATAAAAAAAAASLKSTGDLSTSSPSFPADLKLLS